MSKTNTTRWTVNAIRFVSVVVLATGLGSVRAPLAAGRVLGFVEAVFDNTALAAPRSVAVSPDGRHVYVASHSDRALVAFRRDIATGALTYVDVQQDGVGGVDGLSGAASVAVSPDGDHVYVAGWNADALVVFSRNVTSGALTFVEVHKDGVDGVNGLDGAASVALSPDGDHVYVAGYYDDSVTVFTRDVASGELTHIGGGVTGLNGATSVAVSPDGEYVYAAAFLDASVAVFRRDPETGILVTYVDEEFDGVNGVDGLGGANSVMASPDGDHVYVAGSADDAVAVFSRDVASGALTYVGVQKDGVGGVDGLDGAYSVAVSPDGAHVYAAGGHDDALVVFARDRVSGELAYLETHKDGTRGVDGLEGARLVAVSPDGDHVYVAAFNDNAVAVFSRPAVDGGLTYLETQQNGAGGVDGLDAVDAVAVSPDGHHVYTASWRDDAVAAFSRDPTTGALSYLGMHQDGAGGLDGLDGAEWVAVSPDGHHVYAAAGTDDAVVVFSRNRATGTLSYVETQKDGVGVDGLGGACCLAISPDGHHVYVAGPVDDAVTVFSRDPATGALTFVEMRRDGVAGVDGLESTYSVAVSPDGHHVYATGSISDNAVAVFSRDRSTGELTFVEMEQDGVGGVNGLYGATSVSVSPDGDHVYVAGRFDDAVAVFGRNPADGKLTFVEMEQDGVGGVDGLQSAGNVTVSPDGDHVFVSGYYDGEVAVFSRNRRTGELAYVESAGEIDGPEAIAVSPDGENVYVAGSWLDEVQVWIRNREAGPLTFASAHWKADGLDGALSVAVSPDGQYVYAAGSSDNAVAVFSRDDTSGALIYAEMEQDGVGGVDGLAGARSVAVSPDGAHVYVAGGMDSAVAVFSSDGGTGGLAFLEMQQDGVNGVDGLNYACSVAISPDGNHVYVAAYFDSAVAVFGRDPDSGALTYVEMRKDGVGDVDGLQGADSVAISPDGKHVYVAAWSDSAVAVFSRDSASGALTYVEMQQDGVGGVDGLDSAVSVTVSPDGDHVYVAGNDDDAVAVFERDSTSGALAFVEMEQDGIGSVDGLNEPYSVDVSADGSFVYVAGNRDNALAVFSRDQATGELTYVEMHKDGVGGVDGLYGASAVADSPEGDHVYVASLYDDAVAVFARQPRRVYLPLVLR
jgi:6-phosphogluconolactonase (cycloisomerase 2 family)